MGPGERERKRTGKDPRISSLDHTIMMIHSYWSVSSLLVIHDVRSMSSIQHSGTRNHVYIVSAVESSGQLMESHQMRIAPRTH